MAEKKGGRIKEPTVTYRLHLPVKHAAMLAVLSGKKNVKTQDLVRQAVSEYLERNQ